MNILDTWLTVSRKKNVGNGVSQMGLSHSVWNPGKFIVTGAKAAPLAQIASLMMS